MNYENFFIPISITACLIVGFCIKNIKSFEKISNDYIPSILALIGALVACVYNNSFDIENVVYGALSGLVSTGMHQAFKNFIKAGGKHGD